MIKILSIILKTIIFSICFAILLKAFVISSFIIPSDSMSPALIQGDYILATKFVSDRNTLKRLLRGTSLNSIINISRNEVLVFNPYTDNVPKRTDIHKFYVKRCIGLPGDTIEIKNGYYVINGLPKEASELQHKLSNTSDSLLISIPEVYFAYPANSNLEWTIKDFGPLYLPKEGEIISLDSTNYAKYKSIIEYETNKIIDFRDNVCLLNDIQITTYRFNKNYYFLGGDNVLNSYDSRYWGPLPQNHIIGKVSLILNSKDNYGNTYFNRILKKVE